MKIECIYGCLAIPFVSILYSSFQFLFSTFAVCFMENDGDNKDVDNDVDDHYHHHHYYSYDV